MNEKWLFVSIGASSSDIPIFSLTPTPPIGVAYLASKVREMGGEAYIIDLQVEDERLVSETLKRLNPDVLAISSVTCTIYKAYNIARIAKNMGVKLIVIGGPHVTFVDYGTLQECPHIDVVARGEGEEIVEDIMYSPLNRIKGITYRDKRYHIKRNPDRIPIRNLDKLPFPAYDLLPTKKYKIPIYGQVASLYTSRGCPFKCTFCVSSLKDGKIWRAKSPKNMIEEIEYLLNISPKINTIFFVDDNFLLNKKRIKLFIKLLVKNSIVDRIQWYCEARVSDIDRELIQNLKRGNCCLVYIGIESANQEMLKFIKKDVMLTQLEKTIHLLNKEEIEVLASYMIGYPNETIQDIQSTFSLAKKLNTTFAQFTILTPFPGTPLFEEMKRKGYLLTYDWSKYSAAHQIVKHKLDLARLLWKMYTSYYLRNSFYSSNLNRMKLIPLIFTSFIKSKLFSWSQTKE